MDSVRFSQKYLEILEDVSGNLAPRGILEKARTSELKDKLSNLFAASVTASSEQGQGYHFGLIENVNQTIGLSSICFDRTIIQDIVYRYLQVMSEFSSEAMQRYAIWGIRGEEHLLRKMGFFVDGVLALKPFIEDEIVQIVPHTCMSVGRKMVELADKITNEYSRLASRFVRVDQQFDRTINYTIIGAEHCNGIPFTDWSYGLQYLDDKLKILALWNELKSVSMKTSIFRKKHRQFTQRFDDTYKSSLMPEVLRRFDFIESFTKGRIMGKDYESLIEVRNAYSGFRADFFKMIDEVKRKSGDKKSIEEIVDSVEDEIRKEMRLARRSIRAWMLVKSFSYMASTAIAYVSLDPIGSLLSIPGLPDQIEDLKATWKGLKHRPNKVIMLVKKIKDQEKAHSRKISLHKD